jgi:hypothetical protein
MEGTCIIDRCAVQVRNLHIQYNHWVESEKFHQRI